MKKFFYTLFVAVFVATIFSCTKEDILLVKQLDDAPQTRFDPIYVGSWEERISNNDSTMVFGPQLANPYNVDVMRQALATIREQDPDFFFPAINTSHYYVRFQPDSYEQMCDLFARDTSIIYFDFPLDREVVSGNSYHDPSIVDTLPTYQYASIRTTKWANLINGFDIDYEILDELFIPDDAGLTIIGYTPRPGVGDITPINPGDSTIWGHPIFPGSVADPNSSGTSVTWNAVNDLEDMAYQITGNSDEEETDTNGSIASPASNTVEPMSSSSNGRWTPSGRIRVYDDIKGGMIPLEGVKVIVYRGCNTKKCYTDSIGNFTCGSFKKKASYKIKWERGYWDIRDGLTGQAYYNGLTKTTSQWNLDIGNDTNHKLLGYATIHRALHRMYYGDNGGIISPTYSSRKIKVGYLDTHPENKEGALGRFIGNNLWLGGAKPDIEIFRISYQKPDGSNVVIPTPVAPSYMFYATCHELGHVTHFRNGKESFQNAPNYYCDSWARFVEYIVGEKEYEELGLLDVLYESTTLNNTMWYQPNTYNIQDWTADPQSNQYNYTPFFIDIYDDYNQREYYQLIFGEEHEDLVHYPIDNISYTNIDVLQSFVFDCESFDEIVNCFRDQSILTILELCRLQTLLEFFTINDLSNYEDDAKLY